MSENKKASVAGYYIKICLSLLIICAVSAGLVSFVNALTAEKIKENLEADKAAAIAAIYGDGVVYETAENDAAVYKISRDGNIIGYCVNTESAGFGGDINMMVGFDGNGEIIEVKIISMSETPGLGSKTGDAEFLSRFSGKTPVLTVNGDGGIDAVAGATISSKAVVAGVNAAHLHLTDGNFIGGDMK